MRTLFASALVLLACGSADRPSRPSGADASSPTLPSGPDAVVLRIPRTGGLVSAYPYPALDSVLWRSTHRAPALGNVIAFGAEYGYLAARDTSGAPLRVDLRLGTVSRVRGTTPTLVASDDGGAIYAVTAAGELTRFTASGGDWKVKPPFPVASLLPQSDGSLIGISAVDDRLVVWRLRPPGGDIADSISLSINGNSSDAAETIATTSGSVGNRVYVAVGSRVLAINTRDLSVVLNVDVDDPVAVLAYTPSGDRVFVASRTAPVLRVVDRFEEDVQVTIQLPGIATELRMDPIGRILLARGQGDSVFAISVATGDVLGSMVSHWRGDLPAVLADGHIAVVRDDDVVLLHPSTLGEQRTIERGARDFWYALRWNGFRPRAAGLDVPVEFQTIAPPTPIDSIGGADSGVVAPPTVAPPTRRNERAEPPVQELYTVSFAAMLNERQAREMARRIRVDGVQARVITSDRDGRTIYRVIMGPYTSRAEAERVGRESRADYWIYEGPP